MDKHEPDRAKGTIFSITGMTCSGCANTVQRVLSRVPGVGRVAVDLSGARAVVEGSARAEDLAAAVTAAGFGAQLVSAAASTGERIERPRSCCC
jgi:copper chaperone CopZ